MQCIHESRKLQWTLTDIGVCQFSNSLPVDGRAGSGGIAAIIGYSREHAFS